MRRRTFVSAALMAGTGLSATGCAHVQRPPSARVVIVGGGFGGATAARTLRRWAPDVDVTLVERQDRFVSCPMSNLVVAGMRPLAHVTRRYDALDRSGVRRVQAEVTQIDPERRELRLADGRRLPYDRLIVSPGVDFLTGTIDGLDRARAQGLAPHAWKAGPETEALHRQLLDLPEGGVFALSVPHAPYRCPPGPYERASLVAQFLQTHKPRAKVLILDANPDIVAKRALFQKAWAELYPGLIEHRPRSEVTAFEASTSRARLADGTWVRADVWNVIPPQQAAAITAPLRPAGSAWVPVNFQSFEATLAPGVHVIGDATDAAPRMPKSAFMTNNQAKVAADAVLALLGNEPVNDAPIVMNTCYSFVSAQTAMRVSSVHKWDAAQRTLLPVAAASGTSATHSAAEAALAHAWAERVWDEAVG